MEQRGLTRKDVEPLIDGQGHVGKVLSASGAPSIETIRQLRDKLGISVEVSI
jgi:antitoxin component HigA of HigAB toxin-antitoxin module